MRNRRVTRFELQLLEKLWDLGPCSVREIQEALPEEHRPAYTTVQTMIYRLEQKAAVRRVKKVGNAHVFEAVLTRMAVRKRLVAELLDMFGGAPASVMSHLVETGQLTLADIRAVEKELARRERKK
ncbi:MAG: transcriptional regulator [Acidobacteria bacterium]|nr:MAG: transcriptional regulator [Acidobacteriota bacterium]PYU46926.1 MAG: transcriptional regulator [Acidobacteriota bacterium]PYU68595.1 MAG: transcriptional regulator [Acidobacteriota bacterium]